MYHVEEYPGTPPMKIKTSELSGVALDWAVAQAIEEEVHHEYVDSEQRKMLLSKWQDYSRNGDFSQQEEWSPSTDWSQGGPLIAKYLMDFCVEHPHTIGAALCDENGMYMNMLFGETHLIAACRAIVAAKLGDEVEVPEALL